MKEFTYETTVTWTGNDGSGTAESSYGRDNEVASHSLPTIPGSAPAEFGGDGVSWTPEELLVGAVSQCHLLTYLFQCSRHGIVVESYVDDAVGTLEVDRSGGQFSRFTLRPAVTISAGDPEVAERLHADAHAACFVGRSLSSEVVIEPTVSMATPPA